MSLAVADRKKVVDAWVAAGSSTRLHIQVQVGGAPLADVLDLAQYCQAAGVDSLLTLPELYFKPATVQDLVSYVELVAKAAPKLPVLYYHIPAMSKVEAFVVAATARIANFKGIKFTCNDLSEGAQVLRTLQDGQEMFLGADTVSSTIYCNDLSEGAQGAQVLRTLQDGQEMFLGADTVSSTIYCNDLSEGAQVLRTLQDGQEMFLGADTVSSTIYCNELREGAQVLRTLQDGQEMFLGADTLIAPAALLGIKSSIGTTFNLFPRLAQDILNAVERNDGIFTD
ncbi:putative N-acetyl neuraminate lyase [Operophtera brumata]|uniref:N-acetylneuraminate lyase n=1 Tax=Operophtera brumata TaxID=104452 RepID=A0A0L7K347_OPEBR|nr:putative N-acetyl neuraminate lyase [Operophtera brumata]